MIDAPGREPQGEPMRTVGNNLKRVGRVPLTPRRPSSATQCGPCTELEHVRMWAQPGPREHPAFENTEQHPVF